MAEGSGDNEENPFSFKKFVKKKSKDNLNSSEDGQDEEHTLSVDLLDVAGSSDIRDEDCRSRDAERESNPFSFKKFLQPDNKTKPSTGPTSLKTLDLANDLPDFVQDHYSGNESPRPRPKAEVRLPDFALDSALGLHPELGLQGQDASPACASGEPSYRQLNNSNPANSKESSYTHQHIADISISPTCNTDAVMRSNNPPAVVSDLNLDIADQDATSDADSENSEWHTGCQTNSTGGLPDFLPDFLPDAALSGTGGARPKVLNVAQMNGFLHLEHNGDSSTNSTTRIQQLEAENVELRRQLEEARQQALQAEQRLSAVISSHDLQQAKDTEDMAALEKIVQQVETNLNLATQRALTAEASNNKLRQQVKQLNKKIQLLEEEKAILQHDHFVKDPLREKTKCAANQLSAAAKTAEHHLRQLLSGVDTLRMVSEMLLSVDKFSDITPPDFSESCGAEGGM